MRTHDSTLAGLAFIISSTGFGYPHIKATDTNTSFSVGNIWMQMYSHL